MEINGGIRWGWEEGKKGGKGGKEGRLPKNRTSRLLIQHIRNFITEQQNIISKLRGKLSSLTVGMRPCLSSFMAQDGSSKEPRHPKLFEFSLLSVI